MKLDFTLGDLENDRKISYKLIFVLFLVFVSISLSAREITLHGLREGRDMYCFTLFVFGIILPGIIVFIIACVLLKDILNEDTPQR